MKIRVLPLVMVAATLLLALKIAGLMATGHFVLSEPAVSPRPPDSSYRPVVAARSPSESSPGEVSPVLAPTEDRSPVTTGSAAPKPSAPKVEPLGGETTAKGDVPAPASQAVAVTPNAAMDTGNTLIERLQSRREALDAREREMDLRENLLKAAEKRLEDRISELQALEGGPRGDERSIKASEDARMKDLVVMYDAMRIKDAARIFDRLEVALLADLVTRMNPRKAGEIMAAMEAQAAERLTTALAARGLAGSAGMIAVSSLPKIQGEPRR